MSAYDPKRTWPAIWLFDFMRLVDLIRNMSFHIFANGTIM